MTAALRSAMDRFETDREALVAILTASGDRALCAGMDLKAFANGEGPALLEGPGGFVYAGFCGRGTCEAEIKQQTKATIRVLPDEEFRSPVAPTWCSNSRRARKFSRKMASL